MRRVQFYPGRMLEEALENEAKVLDVSISALVVDILNEHYGLRVKDTMPISELTNKVICEIEEYIKTLQPGEEFSIENASDTFRNIEMFSAGKISALRANIGRRFAKNVGKDRFEKVTISYKTNGKPKKNFNNATMYKVKEEK